MSSVLCDLLTELAIAEAAAVADRLEAYRGLIQRYGRRLNLVGNLESDFVRRQLIGGSLQLLRVGRPTGHLVDLGSGAGLPGIPLALTLPDLEITLVESRQKRAAFLTRSVTLLDLANVRVLTRDAHELSGPYDWVVSRAFKPPAEWLPLARRLVRPGGRVGFYTTTEAWAELRLPDGLRLENRADDPTGTSRIVVCLVAGQGERPT